MAQTRPSANALLQPQSRRRLSTLNFGMVFILIGLVGAIVCAIAFGVTRMNAAPTNGMVSGGPVTQSASSTQELGLSGPSVDTAGNPPASQPDTVIVQKSAEKPLAESTPTAAPTQSASASSADEASSERRETQRRAADAERQRLEQQQERADTAMRSLGGVTVADQRGSIESASVAPSTATTTQMGAREYAAPSGPILALDTAIPVELTHSIDSTFAGSIALPVTANVLDETGTTVLIPQGSTCFAKSAAGGVDGQDRIFVSVDLCKLPDRSRLVLDDFPVVDTDGATGVKARVDDHGASRRNRGSIFSALPGLAGTMIPGGGIGESVAMGATSAAQQSQAGRAVPGPTLHVDASADKPRTLSILVTQDTPIGVKLSEVSQ